MKLEIFIFVLRAFGVFLLTSNALAQSLEPKDVYTGCIENNADLRKKIEAAPVMPDVSKLLVGLTIDDRICDCIKSNDATSKAQETNDLKMRYLSANAICLPAHVNTEFPKVCPDVYRALLPTMGYKQGNPEQINEACLCASTTMQKELTPQSFLEFQLAEFRYYEALVYDRKNKTNTADALRPSGPGAFLRGIQGVKSCVATVFGEPNNNRP